MIKQDIVDNVAKATGLTKVEVEAVLNESFIDTVSNIELSQWSISSIAFKRIFQRLNERLDDNWREFLSTYGCI